MISVFPMFSFFINSNNISFKASLKISVTKHRLVFANRIKFLKKYLNSVIPMSLDCFCYTEDILSIYYRNRFVNVYKERLEPSSILIYLQSVLIYQIIGKDKKILKKDGILRSY